MNLPKGTEHFMSDIHGEYEAFCHILNNCSGVIREKAERVFRGRLSDKEQGELCTLIYYPVEKLKLLKREQHIDAAWYRDMLSRMLEIARVLALDYHSNIIVPKEIKDFSRFSSELKNVLEFIAISDDKSKLNEIKNDSSYEHLEIDTVQLINECTNSKISIAQGEKEVNMCKGLEDLMDDCREEGRCESIERMLRMGRTPEEIADFCGYDLDKVKQVEQKMLAIR